MRRIKIRFEEGEEFTATLLQNQAPETCEVIWNSLPLESIVKQSRWSGREVNLSYTADYPIRENQTIYTSIGEVCYWRDWDWEGSTSHSQAIAIYYGAELTRSHKGNEPVNIFAQIDYKQLQTLSNVGERIWLKGAESIFIEQVTE